MIDLSRFENLLSGGKDSTQPSFTNNELNLQLQKNLCNQCTVIPGVLGGIGSVIQQVVGLM
jgi:hypothetical protein